MTWNPFTVSTLTLTITSFILTLLLLPFGKTKLHRIWGLYNLSVTFWGIAGFFAGISQSAQLSLLWWRIAHIGVVAIPIFLFYATLLFCNVKRPNFLKLVFLQGLIFIFLIPSNSFFSGVRFIFSQFYYPILGPIYHLFFFLWILIVMIAQYELYLLYKRTSGIRKTQTLYLFAALVLGLLGGVTNFLPGYVETIYPFGNFAIPLYGIIVTYAIFKYRLLDISIVITRTGIFIAIYSLVLGIPFAIAFGWQKKLIGLLGDNWWMVPLVSSTVLATTGPFIYLYIQKRAEDQIMHEQRKYQNTLRHASAGMGGIKDLKKLLNFIVHIINRAVQLEHCSVYLHNSFNKNFVLGAYRRKRGELRTIGYLDGSSPLVDYLTKHKEPLVHEEIKQKAQDFSDPQLARVELVMKDLDAAVVVPSFIEDRLMAIIMLGKKRSEKLFSESDLAVFTIVANQAALAIENAQFYEDMKKTHEQLFRAEKMATIGTMADGLSHQINNRLHALGFIAGDVMDSIKLKRGVPMPAEVQQLLTDIDFGLQRIQDNVKQGGEIVQGLLKYTRKDESRMGAVDFDQLIKSSIEMAQYKVKTSQLRIIKDYPLDLPKIKGNFTQLQEVFFNLIDNANDAMMQRKTEKKEPDYVPQFQITASVESNHLEIHVIDNGIGVKKEDREKLFTPFFTTKLSSKKGTGLGLYVLQKIIEENHNGHVRFFSEYMKETRFVIQLPIVV